MKLWLSLWLFLLGNLACFGQSTNAIVGCNISYSTNGTDWVTANIYSGAITNGQTRFFRAVSLVVRLINNQTDISSVVYSGTSITNINTEVYTGYFIVNSDSIQVRSLMDITKKTTDCSCEDGCTTYEVDIIYHTPPTPNQIIFICLDGTAVFDFGCG